MEFPLVRKVSKKYSKERKVGFGFQKLGFFLFLWYTSVR